MHFQPAGKRVAVMGENVGTVKGADLRPIRCENVSAPDSRTGEGGADAMATVPSAKALVIRLWIDSSEVPFKGRFHDQTIHDRQVVIAEPIERGATSAL